MSEATCTINGVVLSEQETRTLRCAVESFATSLEDGLGNDEHGRAMTARYLENLQRLREHFCLDQAGSPARGAREPPPNKSGSAVVPT